MIPAVFAAIFGPRVGALGAGIGIFKFSDILKLFMSKFYLLKLRFEKR